MKVWIVFRKIPLEQYDDRDVDVRVVLVTRDYNAVESLIHAAELLDVRDNIIVASQDLA